LARRLLYLNGIAILCVILFHTGGWGFTAMFAWTPRYLPVSEPVFDQTGSPAYYWVRFAEQIVAIAIPAFLLVSGYFIAFLTGRRENLPWLQILGRIKRLLVPYTIWTLLVWIGWFFILGDRYPLKSYVVNFLTGSTTIGYYYVPLLIQYYLLAPIIIPFAKKNWVPLIIITGSFQLILQIGVMSELMYGAENINPVMYWLAFMPKWLFLSRLFWFVLGMVIGFHLKEFKEFISRFKWIFLITALILIPLGMWEWEAIFKFSGREWLNMRETILDSVYGVAFIFAFLGFSEVALPGYKEISDLGAKSYGIYLAHIPVMEYTAKLIYFLAPAILGIQIIFQPVIFIVGLSIPLVLMRIVNKSFLNRYYIYLFG
jgi:peptidoglycan/LPS O-acetylase OafA/YrhL